RSAEDTVRRCRPDGWPATRNAAELELTPVELVAAHATPGVPKNHYSAGRNTANTHIHSVTFDPQRRPSPRLGLEPVWHGGGLVLCQADHCSGETASRLARPLPP